MSVVKVENLSKLYRINDSRSDLLRDAITGVFAGRRKPENIEELWALNDVNFSVDEGETFGIIGKNGAGKSTLLRILSRITKPTRGVAEIKGRVGSLLEVGTGFHNELSGRENIYLNGAILGMRRTEIQARFDEIVDFSEIGEFLDTPVKHYSSGMYMRLAFSVAAHLQPEVLIVDEVLAVGDLDFQKKCLGKMDEVKRSGRTVIFVSHQLAAVAQLCQRSILLEKGSIVLDGPTDIVLDHYITHGRSRSATFSADGKESRTDMYVQNAVLRNRSGQEQSSFRHDDAIAVEVACVVKKWVQGAELRMVVSTSLGINVFTADAELTTVSQGSSFVGTYLVPAETLRPNNYFLSFALFVPHQYVIESIEDAINFSVYDAGSKYAKSEGEDYGVVFSPGEWKVRALDQ